MSLCFSSVFDTACALSSELDSLIQFSALGAAGAVHIRVVGIDIAAIGASEDAVLRRRGMKAPAPHFGINSHEGQQSQQHDHVSLEEFGRGHITAWLSARW